MGPLVLGSLRQGVSTAVQLQSPCPERPVHREAQRGRLTCPRPRGRKELGDPDPGLPASTPSFGTRAAGAQESSGSRALGENTESSWVPESPKGGKEQVVYRDPQSCETLRAGGVSRTLRERRGVLILSRREQGTERACRRGRRDSRSHDHADIHAGAERA